MAADSLRTRAPSPEGGLDLAAHHAKLPRYLFGLVLLSAIFVLVVGGLGPARLEEAA